MFSPDVWSIKIAHGQSWVAGSANIWLIGLQVVLFWCSHHARNPSSLDDLDDLDQLPELGAVLLTCCASWAGCSCGLQKLIEDQSASNTSATACDSGMLRHAAVPSCSVRVAICMQYVCNYAINFLCRATRVNAESSAGATPKHSTLLVCTRFVMEAPASPQSQHIRKDGVTRAT